MIVSGEQCFTPSTLAKRWRCRPSKVRAYLRLGLLAGFRLDGDGRGAIRIPPEEVQRFESGHAATAVKPMKRREKRDPDFEEIRP